MKYSACLAMLAIFFLSSCSSDSDDVEICEAVQEEKTAVDDAVSYDDSQHNDCVHGAGSYHGIQHIIFDGYGCTNGACHGRADSPSGGLDLRASVSHENLFRVNATANLTTPMQLIYPGEQGLSFLYQKVAAGTQGTELAEGAGSSMPVGFDPLTDNHLEALRLWIRAGAPQDGNVAGVNELLGCGEGASFVANKIDPPPEPAVGEGLQQISGPWALEAHSEDEVCFATYYDLSQTPELLPDGAKVPCDDDMLTLSEECFAYKKRVLTQDPQSHHSIISAYLGPATPSDPSWGEWSCHGGPHDGKICDPTKIGTSVLQGGADCGDAYAVCASTVISRTGCVGWGPKDRRRNDDVDNSVGMGGAQSPVSTTEYAKGVYAIAPTKGTVIWNSHAFNLSAQATTVEQYNNFWFANPEERVYRSKRIFHAPHIFVADVPPYEQRTYCASYTLPRGARLTSLGSHAHKRGILWQTWLPPQDRDCSPFNNCQPNDTEPDYVSRVYNDPLVVTYDPPLEYDMKGKDNRTIKYCLTYDNGRDFPDLLKRNSTSVGSTCVGKAYCAGGSNAGTYCGADDSICGCNGSCDACVVNGGVTTEDEMFILLGNFYKVELAGVEEDEEDD